MLVARRSFTALYGGERIQVTAGQTRIAEGHEIATTHPYAFVPVSGTAASVLGRERVYAALGDELTAALPSERGGGITAPRQGSARPTRKAGSGRRQRPSERRAAKAAATKVAAKPVNKPEERASASSTQPPRVPTADAIRELWDRRGGPTAKPARGLSPSNVRSTLDTKTPSQFVVRLGLMAERDLADECRATERDGLEVGVALYGQRPKAWGSEIEIRRIGTAGRNAVREPRALGRDHSHESRQAQSLRRLSNSGLVEVGFAHTHPGGSSAPSRTDLHHFTSRRLALGLKSYAAIIATPARSGGWDFHAWVTREHSRDHDVCEPAEIIT